MKSVPSDPVKFDPQAIAIRYYFGDLNYWQLPAICVEALERGFDGKALRIIAGLVNPTARDIRQEEINSAFSDMGVNAPIPKEEARLALATEAARRALSGESNVFHEATHIGSTSANCISRRLNCRLLLRSPRSLNTQHAGSGRTSKVSFMRRYRISFAPEENSGGSFVGGISPLPQLLTARLPEL